MGSPNCYEVVNRKNMEPIQTKQAGQSSSSDASASGDMLETLVEALSHSEASVRESAALEFAKRKDKR